MIYPSVGQYTEAIKLAEQSPEDYLYGTLNVIPPYNFSMFRICLFFHNFQ